MKRMFVLLLLVTSLGGCSMFSGDLSALPAYTSIGSTILEAELRVDLVTLSDAVLAERNQIMTVLVPTLEQLSTLAVVYRTDINEEISRRQIAPPE